MTPSKQTVKVEFFGSHVRIADDVTWPSPDPGHAETLEWHLRYGTPSKEQCLTAASYLSAYTHMIFLTQEKRNYICAAIQAGIKARFAETALK